MTITEITDKISRSPSSSLLLWVGAFVLGIAAATGIFPTAHAVPLGPLALSCFCAAAIGGFAIKDKGFRLFGVAGFFFFGGALRYLSSTGADIDLLAAFPLLAAAKGWLIAAISDLLPEPQAGFLSGLIVGGGVRSPELKAAFVATGTAHVMALSGWNVNIISKWLDNALVFLHFGKRARWALIVFALSAFVIMTGASASLVRAASMSFIMTIALSSGRKAAPARALAYTSAVMLAFSPRLLAADLGFLLSVAATAGIVFLSPLFRPLTGRLPGLFGLPQTAADTLGATLATLPITLCAFGQFSLIALPANLLLLPFIPATIGVGFSAALIAGLFPSLAGLCRWAAGMLIGYDMALVRLLSRLPGSSVGGVYIGVLIAAAMALSIILIAAYAHHRSLEEEACR